MTDDQQPRENSVNETHIVKGSMGLDYHDMITRMDGQVIPMMGEAGLFPGGLQQARSEL